MFMLPKRAGIAIAATLGVALGTPWAVPAVAGSVQSNAAMQTAAPVLQSGDLVRLRSGGPLMTVTSVQGDQVICFWSNGDGEVRSGAFPVAVITAPFSLLRLEERE